MIVSKAVFLRGLLAALALFAALALDVTDAYAQSANCARLQQSLNAFDRNGDFRGADANGQNARALAQEVQAAESSYVRNGCNDDAKAGRVLTPSCQAIGRSVLKLRADYAKVSQSVQTGAAVAQQREGILQELARFGCGADQNGSSASFSNQRQGVFDRVFGTSTDPAYQDGTLIDGQDVWGNSGGYSTVRTVCVRLSDGYFWPVSYSTLEDMVGNDAAACSKQCPGTATDIYYYRNPGQEAEDMINMFNAPYTELPNAFRYRRELDANSTCKPKAANGGNVTTSADASGQVREMVTLDGATFPLPLRDPRRALPAPVTAEQPVQPVEPETVQTADLIDIPLPRPRPAAPGEAPVARPVADSADKTLRLVQFGDKVVRVVGPDTPYAQATPAGT